MARGTQLTSSGSAAERLHALLTPSDALSVGTRGVLHIDGQSAERLLQRYGSPLYVLCEKTLRANYRRIQSAFAGAWPGQVRILYAAKANNGLALRAVLSNEGAGGECFGVAEMHATLSAGANPADVVLNGSNKSEAEFHMAVAAGVTINIDAEEEIAALQSVCRNLRKTARVKLRLKVAPSSLDLIKPDYLGANTVLSSYLCAEKWGFSKATAIDLVKHISRIRSLEFHGFSSHVGRVSADPRLFQLWLHELGAAIREIADAAHVQPRIVGIGGGWARQREPESRTMLLNDTPIEDYAAAACASLRQAWGGWDAPTPLLEIEPGRYIAGNAAILLTTVGAIKRDIGRVWINVDASTNNLMRIDTNGCRYHVLPAVRMHATPVETASVVGLTCIDSVLAERVDTPRLRRGDAIAILDAGMYAETTSTQFNGIPRPATILVNGRQVDIVKRRETIRDVFAKHRIPARLRPRRNASRLATKTRTSK